MSTFVSMLCTERNSKAIHVSDLKFTGMVHDQNGNKRQFDHRKSKVAGLESAITPKLTVFKIRTDTSQQAGQMSPVCLELIFYNNNVLNDSVKTM